MVAVDTPAEVRTQPKRSVRDETPRGRRIASRIFGYAVLILFSLIFIYPFIIQLANSFKTEPDAANDPLSAIPHPFTTSAFEKIFDNTDFPRWLTNSVLIAIVVTLSRVFFDSLAGYALARMHFRGRAIVFAT